MPGLTGWRRGTTGINSITGTGTAIAAGWTMIIIGIMTGTEIVTAFTTITTMITTRE